MRGRLVLDEHHEVVHERGQLVGDRVERLVDEGVEALAVHLDRHGPIVPGTPEGRRAARAGEAREPRTWWSGALASMATPTGLEPAASAVTGRRANQLRYGALALTSALTEEASEL